MKRITSEDLTTLAEIIESVMGRIDNLPSKYRDKLANCLIDIKQDMVSEFADQQKSNKDLN